MARITCPDCHQTYPGGERAGHCAACHQTFIGLVSFDAHRVGPFPDGRHCQIQPYESTTANGGTRYGHWADADGNWHHGRKLTQADRERLYGDAA